MGSKEFPVSAHPYLHDLMRRLGDYETEVKEWFEEGLDGRMVLKERETQWWGPVA